MPGPFPGMDPYIEDVEIWRGAHHWFITAASEQLQPQLNPRGYFVDVENRVWMEEPGRAVYPDVILREALGKMTTQYADTGGTLVADEPVRLHTLETEMREDYLQIYEAGTRHLVTGLEFISPTNKSEHVARKLYLRKREELWAGDVNVVEIDLLRGGKSLVRLPVYALKGFRPGGYIINVMRVGSAGYEFYPVDLRTRLPRVGIPLKPGEPDVVLDLQAALNRVYDLGAYSMRIDYNREPDLPLDEEAAAWATSLLLAAGVRKPPASTGPANGPDVSNG